MASIEEQRRVEGFGDPQYACDDIELAVRRRIYRFFQGQHAAGRMQSITMTQDWSGNTLHITGNFEPKELARQVAQDVRGLLEK
jgi:hypothetical protein